MTRIAISRTVAALLAGLLMLAITPARAVDGVTLNDTARYLAGMQPSPGSPLTALTKDQNWQYHARTLDQAWAQIEKRQLGRIRAWSKKHLPEHRDFMLYMFSGPDFLYADAFYPNAATYVFSALEPIGSVPRPTRMSRGERASGLQELRGSMQTVLSYSFFRTKQMKVEFRSGSMQGALPLLFVFMARAGNTINDAALVSLNPDGTLSTGGAAAKGASPGLRIDFTGEKGKARRLYYFQTDLSNGGLPNSGFMTFCDTFGPADTLVKSASYLLHGGYFSTARDYLLQKSAVIIQDDSGIPLRYFERKTWDLNPFGRYAGPIDLFANKYQRDMAVLFSRGRAERIDFGIGYKWRTHETNLLLAINKQAPPKPEAKRETKPDVMKTAAPEEPDPVKPEHASGAKKDEAEGRSETQADASAAAEPSGQEASATVEKRTEVETTPDVKKD